MTICTATVSDEIVLVIDSETSNAVLYPGDRNRRKYPFSGSQPRVHTYIYTCVRRYARCVYPRVSARTREAHHGSRQSNDNDRNRLRAVKITTSDAEQKRSLFNASTWSEKRRETHPFQRRPRPDASFGTGWGGRNNPFFQYIRTEILSNNRKGLRFARKSSVASTFRILCTLFLFFFFFYKKLFSGSRIKFSELNFGHSYERWKLFEIIILGSRSARPVHRSSPELIGD